MWLFNSHYAVMERWWCYLWHYSRQWYIPLTVQCYSCGKYSMQSVDKSWAFTGSSTIIFLNVLGKCGPLVLEFTFTTGCLQSFKKYLLFILENILWWVFIAGFCMRLSEIRHLVFKCDECKVSEMVDNSCFLATSYFSSLQNS